MGFRVVYKKHEIPFKTACPEDITNRGRRDIRAENGHSKLQVIRGSFFYYGEIDVHTQMDTEEVIEYYNRTHKPLFSTAYGRKIRRTIYPEDGKGITYELNLDAPYKLSVVFPFKTYKHKPLDGHVVSIRSMKRKLLRQFKIGSAVLDDAVKNFGFTDVSQIDPEASTGITTVCIPPRVLTKPDELALIENVLGMDDTVLEYWSSLVKKYEIARETVTIGRQDADIRANLKVYFGNANYVPFDIMHHIKGFAPELAETDICYGQYELTDTWRAFQDRRDELFEKTAENIQKAWHAVGRPFRYMISLLPKETVSEKQAIARREGVLKKRENFAEQKKQQLAAEHLNELGVPKNTQLVEKGSCFVYLDPDLAKQFERDAMKEAEEIYPLETT